PGRDPPLGEGSGQRRGASANDHRLLRRLDDRRGSRDPVLEAIAPRRHLRERARRRRGLRRARHAPPRARVARSGRAPPPRLRGRMPAPGPADELGARRAELSAELGHSMTLDGLTRDFKIFQRRRGHRHSTDDLLTAWYAVTHAPPRPIETLLDLGTGIGSV